MQGESFQEEGKAILGKFHDWVSGGAGGASGWELEKENHEGWRVAVDEARCCCSLPLLTPHASQMD